MQSILNEFNIDQERLDKIILDCTLFVKQNKTNQRFSYLSKLLESDSYLQFGADKCGVDSFKKFCKDLDIVENDGNHYYNRDYTLTFTCSDNDHNYLHYFGVTGETSKVIEVFKVVLKRMKYDVLCLGNRDYI
jgi:hypothetical protein